MDPRQTNIAEQCLKAAYDGTMAFPDIVGTLIEAGFDGYIVDYRRNTTTYYRPDGDSVVLKNRASESTVAADFDQVGVAARIKWAQSGPPDYSYAGFSKQVKVLGCAGYIVPSWGAASSTSAVPPKCMSSISRPSLKEPRTLTWTALPGCPGISHVFGREP